MLPRPVISNKQVISVTQGTETNPILENSEKYEHNHFRKYSAVVRVRDNSGKLHHVREDFHKVGTHGHDGGEKSINFIFDQLQLFSFFLLPDDLKL